MYYSIQTFLALSMTLGASLASPHPRNVGHLVERRQTTDPSNCATGIHIMAGGGRGTTNQNTLLTNLVNLVFSAFPGSDEYLVPYTGSPTQARDSTPVMIAAYNNYTASCPNTPIVMMGYSLGGIIVMNTLCGGVAPALPNMIAAIVYGDETYVGGLSYDTGNCTLSSAQYPRANTAICQSYAPAIQSYCDFTDPQCCGNGTVQQTHYEYASKYDNDSFAFIQAQYNAFRANQANPTLTSSSTVSVTTVTATTTVTPTSSTTTTTAPSTSTTSTTSTTSSSSTTTTSSSSTTSTSSSTSTTTSSSTSTTTSSSTSTTSSSSTSTTSTTSSSSTTTAPQTTSTSTSSSSSTSKPSSSSTTTPTSTTTTSSTTTSKPSTTTSTTTTKPSTTTSTTTTKPTTTTSTTTTKTSSTTKTTTTAAPTSTCKPLPKNFGAALKCLLQGKATVAELLADM